MFYVVFSFFIKICITFHNFAYFCIFIAFTNAKNIVWYWHKRGGSIKKRLANEVIYNDFIKKTKLSKEEITILNMYLRDESYIKIGIEVGLSPRSVGNRVKQIKDKYRTYKEIETALLEALLKK